MTCHIVMPWHVIDIMMLLVELIMSSLVNTILLKLDIQVKEDA